MATINPDKLREALRTSVIKTIEAGQQAVNDSILSLYADFKERIFQDGLDADGGQIGTYSTKPIYVSINSQTSQVRKSSLKPKGKSSSKDFKNGKKRKSQYMPGGYSEFRTVVGRQNQKVDLFLTGSLMGSIVLGESGNARTIGFLTDEKVEIAEGNQNRFGKTIFAVSSEELSKFEDAVEAAATKAFFSAFE